MKRFSKSEGREKEGRPRKGGPGGDRKKFSDRKPFNRTAGSSPSFKRDENKDERRDFKKERGTGDSGGTRFKKPFGPKRTERSGDKPFDRKKSFTRSSDKPRTFKRDEGGEERRSFKKERGTDDSGGTRFKKPFGPKRTERSNEKPFDRKKSFNRSPDKPRTFKRDDDSAEKKSFHRERGIGDSPKPRFEKPFRPKRSAGSGDTFEKKKPFQSGDQNSIREKRPRKDDTRGSFKKREGDREERPWNRKEKHNFYGDRRKPKAPPRKLVDDGSTRLNKYIANAGICSRREADELITAGVVSVNGNIITEMGFKVMPGDIVKYNNEQLRSEQLVYVLLNKPKDFITTTEDPGDRKTVMGLVAKACKERIYPVGRLDRNTTGLLLFTNDGDLAKKLTHPSFQVHKVYQVELDRALKITDMELVSQGVTLDDGFVKADEIAYVAKEKNVIGIELHSGKNRVVRRIFEHLGYEVKKLDRVIFAGLTKKDLPRGRWRFLTEMEIAGLKMLSGKSDKMVH